MRNPDQRRKLTVRVFTDAYRDELTFTGLHSETRRRFWQNLDVFGLKPPGAVGVNRVMFYALRYLCRRFYIEVDGRGFDYDRLYDMNPEDLVLVFQRMTDAHRETLLAEGAPMRDIKHLKFKSF